MIKGELTHLGRALDAARETLQATQQEDVDDAESTGKWKAACDAYNVAHEAYRIGLEDLTGQSADVIASRLRRCLNPKECTDEDPEILRREF